MALRSKLLDEEIVKSAEKMLKSKKPSIRFKKTKCYNCSSKNVQYNGCSTKIYSLSRKALTSWIKLLKFGGEEKLFTHSLRRRKTKLNQAQLQQIEVCIEENPNITIKEMRIRIQGKFGLNISKSTTDTPPYEKDEFSYITLRPVHNQRTR